MQTLDRPAGLPPQFRNSTRKGWWKIDSRDLNAPAVRRYYRLTRAARKLAQIDYRRFRDARFAEAEARDFLKIPEVFILAYVAEYARAAKGN